VQIARPEICIQAQQRLVNQPRGMRSVNKHPRSRPANARRNFFYRKLKGARGSNLVAHYQSCLRGDNRHHRIVSFLGRTVDWNVGGHNLAAHSADSKLGPHCDSPVSVVRDHNF
jgi:hypothetical protein